MSHYWTPLHSIDQQHITLLMLKLIFHLIEIYGTDAMHWTELTREILLNVESILRQIYRFLIYISSDNWYFSSLSVLFYTVWLWPISLTDSILDCCKVNKWMQCDLNAGTNMQVNHCHLEMRLHSCTVWIEIVIFLFIFLFWLIVQPWLLIGASWQRRVF